MHRIITLTTDFGTRDGFVGTMKGVILSINPDATIVDITHEIAPQDVEEGAFLFAASAKYFPSNAIHVVVVDPGVGSARRAIGVQGGETIFVAPDNGVLTKAIDHWQLANRNSKVRTVRLNRPEYWLPRVSNTFHGRDIFAPCAAHLSLGVSLEEMGEPITDWITLRFVLPTRRADGAWVGRVVHIDRYGNIVTNIAAEMLRDVEPSRVVVEIAGKKIVGFKRAYADGAEGELIALVSSSWELEISQRNGNAAKTLGILNGSEVVVLG